jgi:hypothetical protein
MNLSSRTWRLGEVTSIVSRHKNKNYLGVQLKSGVIEFRNGLGAEQGDETFDIGPIIAERRFTPWRKTGSRLRTTMSKGI